MEVGNRKNPIFYPGRQLVLVYSSPAELREEDIFRNDRGLVCGVPPLLPPVGLVRGEVV